MIAALVAVFLFVAGPFEAIQAGVVDPAKDGPSSPFGGVFVDYRPDEMHAGLPVREKARQSEHRGEVATGDVKQIGKLSSAEVQASEIVVPQRPRISGRLAMTHDLNEHPAFYNRSVPAPDIDQGVHDLNGLAPSASDGDVPKDDARSVAGQKLLPGEIDSLRRKTRLTGGYARQDNSEHGDEDRRDGGKGPIVVVNKREDAAYLTHAEWVLAWGLALSPVIAIGAGCLVLRGAYK
jgi:hypothetical protein